MNPIVKKQINPIYKRIFKIVGGILYTLAIGFLGFIIYPKFMNWYEDPVLVTPKEIILNPQKYGDYRKPEGLPEFQFTYISQQSTALITV